MIHEMLDSTRATAQVPLQALAHDTPAKAGPITDGSISVLYAQDTLFDQVKHLAVERRLEPVRHVSRKLFLQMDRLLADRIIEANCLLNRVRRRLPTAHDFH